MARQDGDFADFRDHLDIESHLNRVVHPTERHLIQPKRALAKIVNTKAADKNALSNCIVIAKFFDK